MQTPDVTVWLQALDGTWENCGADREVGVVPETFQAVSDPWGPLTASFDLRRMPGAIWPDLASWAPVMVEIGGVPVFRGTTGETPIRDGADFVVNVQCKGRQAHLDDDVYQRVYAHTRLGDYKDMRSIPSAVLGAANLYAGGTVSTDNALAISMPNGVPLSSGSHVGVVLDLGPNSSATSVSFDYELTSAASTISFHVRGASTPDKTGWPGSDATGSTLDRYAASGTISANITASRYLQVFLYSNTAVTPSADITVKITGLRVFTDTAYRSGDASALKAPTVINDALDRATLLLSDDRSQIQATSFNIDDLAPERYITPREQIEAVNAFHNWITKIDLADRMVFKPRPTAPLLEIGSWPGSEFTDASANAGDEIYNRAILTGNDGDGTPVAVERHSGEVAGTAASAVGIAQPPNPSFDVDTSSWSLSRSGAVTFARVTTPVDTSPGAGRLQNPGPGIGFGTISTTITGTFERGLTYRLDVALRYSANVSSARVSIASSTDGAVMDIVPSALPSGWIDTYRTWSVAWTPEADASSATLTVAAVLGDPSTFYIDSVRLLRSVATIVDRRRFRRTKVIEANFAVSPTGGQQLVDTFLAGHRTTPLKGSVRITPGGCRTVLGGASVHPSVLLTRTQELLRLAHRIDPDTGSVGRVGTIAQVTYTHRDQTAAVELDDPRRNFDVLVSRLASVQGAG